MVTAYVVRGEPVDVVNYLANSPVRGITNYIGSNLDPIVMYGVGGVITASSFGTGVGVLGHAAYSLHSMDTVILDLDCN